jgi:cbb3-type cytochrome oxidase maturation protein
MDILYLLVPVSVLLALGVLGVFAWALQGGQFEDVEAEGERILADEAPSGVAPGGAADVQPDVDRPGAPP